MSATHDAGLDEQVNFLRPQQGGVAPGASAYSVAHPRPHAGDFQVSAISTLFTEELSGKIRAHAQQAGLSPFELMLSGFKALLFRYSGQSPVVVCIPADDANRAGSLKSVNCFMNWTALRTRVAADMTFEQLARRIHEQAGGPHSQDDLLSEKIAADFESARHVHLDALSVVAFELQAPSLHSDPVHRTLSTAESGPQNKGGESEHSDNASHTVQHVSGNDERPFKFDLRISLAEAGRQFGLNLEYNTDLFEQGQLQRFAEHFQTLIEAAVARPRSCVGELPLMTSGERRQVLVEWNETAAEYPSQMCVQELFEAQVQRTPNAPALLFASDSLSYAQLNERANGLAHHLRARGIGPEQVVGICLEGSLDLPVAVLAVIKAGAAYLPLDPAYPPGRISYMAGDAGVKLILTQQRLLEKFAELAGATTVIALDAEQEIAAVEPTHNPVCLTTPRNACYVIYTSGSTGRPKGVVIEHRSLVNLVGALKAVCGVGPGDRVLQFASFSFDQSVREIFEPLLSGAELCLERRERLMPGKPLLDVLREQRITAVTLAPSVLAHLPEAALPALTKLSAGGEALPASVVDRWAVGRQFFNAYGPSEITFASSLPRCRPGAGKPTIGKPLQNVRYYVVDERMQPCGIGMTGELLVGGAGLARGYFNRPEMTAERFIPDPFSGESGARLYRTGDLVRWLPNGNVDYLGRIDQQVKLHGLRIELGEIETVLMEHQAVLAATVMLHAEAAGKEQLVAYVVPSHADLPLEEVKGFLASKVPGYMVPAVFIVIEQIPLTPAGKVDKRALPLPDSVRQQKTYVPLRSPAEEKMAEIWKRVLDVKDVSADDNFFELGGSSLRGTTLLALIEDEFKVKPSFAKIFENPTLRELTEFLDGSKGQESSSLHKGAVLLRQAEEVEEQAQHIFFIHDASGGVDTLLPLGKRLSPAWNVWGIQAGQLDPDEIPDVSIENMAADYIEEMCAIQPDGPWFVGGWSFGGIVAYEMARQLGGQSKGVGLLTFIDSEVPNKQRWDAVLTDFVNVLKATFKPAAAAVSSVADKSKACQLLLNRISRYQNAGERIRACTPHSIAQAIAGWDELDEERLFAALRRVMSYVGALAVYETGARVEVDAEDFRAMVKAAPTVGDDWGALVSGRVRHHWLEGDHRSILSLPLVQGLATTLNEALEERFRKLS